MYKNGQDFLDTPQQLADLYFCSLEFGQNKNADKQIYVLTSVADPDFFY